LKFEISDEEKTERKNWIPAFAGMTRKKPGRGIEVEEIASLRSQ